MTTTTVATRRFTIDPLHSSVDFSVRHLMIAKVRGRFKAFAGTIDLPAEGGIPSAVSVQIDAASIDTHVPDRDNHLRSPDFLDVANFPAIAFESTKVEAAGAGMRIHGLLTLHGVTRDVVLEAEYLGAGNDPSGNRKIGYEAGTTISRKEFGVTFNPAIEGGGIAIGDELRIEINIEAMQK